MREADNNSFPVQLWVPMLLEHQVLTIQLAVKLKLSYVKYCRGRYR